MTADSAPKRHVPRDLLRAYAAHELGDEEESQVDRHLAQCDECVDVAAFEANLAEAIDEWTAASHGEAYWAEFSVRALRTANETHPEWKGRLARWSSQWRGRAEVALGLVIEHTSAASGVLPTLIDALQRSADAWQPRTVPVRGAERPVRELIVDGPECVTEVELGASTQDVVVRLKQGDVSWDGRLVVLAGLDDDDGTVDVRELARRVGSKDLSAVFPGIRPGRYVILVEPAG